MCFQGHCAQGVSAECHIRKVSFAFGNVSSVFPTSLAKLRSLVFRRWIVTHGLFSYLCAWCLVLLFYFFSSFSPSRYSRKMSVEHSTFQNCPSAVYRHPLCRWAWNIFFRDTLAMRRKPMECAFITLSLPEGAILKIQKYLKPLSFFFCFSFCFLIIENYMLTF